MKQKSGKMFNLFIVLSMLLGMVVTPALAASGSEAQSAPAAPVTQEDADGENRPPGPCRDQRIWRDRILRLDEREG